MSESQESWGHRDTDGSSKPVDSRRFGRVEAAIWRRESNCDTPEFNWTISRSYRDKAGNWKTSSSFDVYDEPAARDALDWIREQLRPERKNSDHTGAVS